MRLKDNPTLIRITLTTYFVVSFYTFGALVIENDVNYNTWHTIGAAEFPDYHKTLQRLLLPFFMVPLALQLILSILMLGLRQPFIEKRTIIVIVVINVYIVLESMAVQVPIHNQLNFQKDHHLLQALIYTHQRFRLPAEILLFLINVMQLFKVIRRSQVPSH